VNASPEQAPGSSLSVAALGTRIDLDLTALDPDARAAVAAAWTDATIPAGTDDAGTDADAGTHDEPIVVPSAPLRILLPALSQRVTRAAIGRAAGRLWMLHAAGLSLADGQVVAFVAPSGTGKTTATRSCAAVAGYVTDETVGIAPDGTILPYRKPLSLIETPGRPKQERAPSSLGFAAPGAQPLRLGAIVLLERSADAAETPEVEEVELGDALEGLVTQTSYLERLSDPLQRVAGHVAAVGGVRRLRYRDSSAIPGILSRLPAAPIPAPLPEVVTPARDVGSAADHPAVPTSSRRYRRAEFADAIVLPDPERIAVLRERRVTMLAGIGPAIWRAADGRGLADLTAAVAAAHGVPPAPDPVAPAVAALLAAGVLIVEDERTPATASQVRSTSGERTR